MPRRIVLAMSGGVDSSAAAVLLQRQGYEVVGLFMRSGATDDYVCHTGTGPALPIMTAKANKQGCCSASDAADARRVADALDIPFHALNFQDAFGRIKDYFADEYLAGRTPNPCVMCNNWLKFGKLWEFAQSVGADAIATGHYARLIDDDRGHRRLVRGRDPGKDQSYVLFGIARELLDRIVFPVGDFLKPQIRELAAEAGLRVATKPDSQEICFVPDNDYAGFLERYRGVTDTAGEFVDTAGNVLGRHPGFERFTIGQRRGLGITFGEPRFVIRIDAATRQVVLGTKDDLACDGLTADRVNWHDDSLPASFRCRAQIRYQHDAAWATVTTQGDTLSVQFDEPQFGVAPGQAVVLYDDDRVLGGGWIMRGSPVRQTAVPV
ncbi:MAG: tRNA 2-thiouridine(34) synthase MnmA [Planctomycetaceae bacterium]|nr:tRNA 2-thiouridine(34) synthase MnmA [Planctomycetaceae bacterium]